MKRKITFLVVAVLCLQTLLAQNKTIRGTIVDSFSEPIIGASAHVKGTYTGTISDLNGNYTWKRSRRCCYYLLLYRNDTSRNCCKREECNQC